MRQEIAEVKTPDLYVCKIVSSECDWRWLLDELEIANSRELERQILQRIGGLIYDEHVEHNVVLVDVNVGLRINGIREAGKLHNFAEFRASKIKLGRLRRRAERLR